MTVVKFDSVYFDNNILPNVKKTKDDLKKAKSKANSLSIPYDYKYRKYLLNLDEAPLNVDAFIVTGYLYETLNDILKIGSEVFICSNE